METLKKLKKLFGGFLGWIEDILVPEDEKIQKLLDIPAHMMRSLLPKSPVYSQNIFVLFDYRNRAVKLLIKSLKYRDNSGVKKRLAGYLYEELIDISSELALFEGSPPVLVPMPMSKIEKKERGFNQCEELAKEIKSIGGDSIEVSYDALKKIRETKKQATLTKEERRENLKGSMEAAGCELIKNRPVIILDDVYTTGASLSEARRALLSGGAKRVIGLFIAH